MPRVLIVDDDYPTLFWLRTEIEGEGHQVETAGDGQEGWERLREQDFDIVLTDLVMPRMDGMELLKAIKQERERTVVVVMTAHGNDRSGVEAMYHGASFYINKPIEHDVLRIVMQHAVEQARLRALASMADDAELQQHRFGRLLGKSKRMQRVYDLISRVAPSKSHVLVLGESGTGKELAAREIHVRSPRSHRPFVPVSCAAIPETLLESELFGHIKGAYTDATTDRPGLFEQAQGGTIFLDEIGDTTPLIQAKLLRVLQEGELRRLGGDEAIKVDVRVIAATNRDLAQAIAEGKFRQDLYYRLNVIAIEMPPLRERVEDIPLLARHFLRKYAVQHQKDVRSISESALRAMLKCRWTGNVRELENAIERATLLCLDTEIALEDLPPEVLQANRSEEAHPSPPDTMKTLEEVEQEHIERVLRLTGGDMQMAARILGIGRATLYRKRDKLRNQTAPQSEEEGE